MIRSLGLHRFKNFRDATLHLGPFTVLIGANASGKSNIRDAFRFLHGIGLGYSIVEILGEKYIGGERAWAGIRGGTREVASIGETSFVLDVTLDDRPAESTNSIVPLVYSVEVKAIVPNGQPPRLLRESLVHLDQAIIGENGTFVRDNESITMYYKNDIDDKNVNSSHLEFRNIFPIIKQLHSYNLDRWNKYKIYSASYSANEVLQSFRFHDLSPIQMRISSLSGVTVLGDQGENLSSVLQAICNDPDKKEAMLEWVRRLTPMDVADLTFDEDATGRIALRIVETDGRSISVASVSDGTLRFLGILAALFGPDPAQFTFIEELENGIHPTRLGLLVELIESQTKRRGIQVVATCHAPLVLQFLSEEALGDASIVYRLPDRPDAQIRRILDVPEAARVIKEQGAAILHASSWFEDVLNLTEDEPPGTVAAESSSQSG